MIGAADIFGIGVDVLEAARIKKTLARFGEHFVERLSCRRNARSLGGRNGPSDS